MLIHVSKETLEELLQTNIEAWSKVGGGANLDAFDFDPKKIDEDTRRLLDKAGYDVTPPEAWMAGIQIDKLYNYLQEIRERKTL